MTYHKAFTLIELLMTIAIIGILMGVGVYGWNSFQSRERDNVRKADLQRIKSALTLFYADNRYYPDFKTNSSVYPFSSSYQLDGSTNCANRSALSNNTDLKNYMDSIPSDPRVGDKSCADLTTNNINGYIYISENIYDSSSDSTSSKTFELMATMEKDNTGTNTLSSNNKYKNYAGSLAPNYSITNSSTE